MNAVALQEHAEDDLQVDGLSDTDTDDYDVLDEPVPAKDSAQIAKNIKDILRQKNLTLPIRNPSTDSVVPGPKSPQFNLSPEPKSPLFKPLGGNPVAPAQLPESNKTASSSASAPSSLIPGNYIYSFVKFNTSIYLIPKSIILISI